MRLIKKLIRFVQQVTRALRYQRALHYRWHLAWHKAYRNDF